MTFQLSWDHFLALLIGALVCTIYCSPIHNGSANYLAIKHLLDVGLRFPPVLLPSAFKSDHVSDRISPLRGSLCFFQLLNVVRPSACLTVGLLCCELWQTDDFSIILWAQKRIYEFFLMAILRIKNPEQINRRNPQKLGRILGLDRAPSVKTLRCKIRILASRAQGVNLMTLLGKKRFAEATLPDAILYIDGHVQCYYGKRKLGKTFSTTRNRALKATTDYWVNLGDGTPLLCIPTEFNQSMSRILPELSFRQKSYVKTND